MTAPDCSNFPHQDLVTLADWSAEDITRVFQVARTLKADREGFRGLLDGKRVALIFEKDSLRTRMTFDLGIQQLGGSAVYLDHRHERLGARESVPDMAHNLERWVDLIVARTYRHRHVAELADHASVPVINGLSELLHPCQALADLLTLHEKWDGQMGGKKLVYIGDGNNTCHSLLHAAPKLGMHMTVCTPEGYEPNFKVMETAREAARIAGVQLEHTSDPQAAATGAHAIYTDVWASMGQEDETEERAAVFIDYQVDEDLMSYTDDAFFMHCLPAHRGQEVTAGVLDGPASIVFDIAENRLHVQKAVMALLLLGQEGRSPSNPTAPALEEVTA